jgi:3-oxoadipate enol-lactonase
MLLACDPVGYAGCCAAIRDMDQRPTVGLNRTPTLVIAGTEDPSTTPADGAFLANSAGQGTLLTIPAAHLSNIECPDIFGNAVTEFLLRR